MAQKGLTREEKKRIDEERKKLRKELRLVGIHKRREFEEIARMMDLVYGNDHKALFGWWKFTDALKSWKKWAYFLACIIILAIVFIFSVIANQKGNFLVSMTSSMIDNRLSLSDKEDLSVSKVALSSDILGDVNACSIQDMPDNLDEKEGSHNTADAVCYTFWVTNKSENAYGYDWYLVLNSSTQNVEETVWIMIYVDGEMTLYSRPSALGGAEAIGEYETAPLIQQCANPDEQYILGDNGLYTIVSVPYLENRIVAKGRFEEVEPEETHKFTVIIWMEGDDPDCSEELVGGHAGYSLKFTSLGDNAGIYSKYGRRDDDLDAEKTGIEEIFDDLYDQLNRNGCFGEESSEE